MTERETQQQVGLLYECAVAEMEETLKSFLRQYDAGRKTWMDVLNVQKEVSDVRLQLEQARTTWLEMSLRLAAITGQLDSAAEVKP
jgi:adhesin transport system outer membrane protein